MRLFWKLQAGIGAAAIAGSIALNGGCSSTSGGGTAGGPLGSTDTETDTTDTIETCTSTDDTCLGGGPCCDLEVCAGTYCMSVCYPVCDFSPDASGCSDCLQTSCAAQSAACP